MNVCLPCLRRSLLDPSIACSREKGVCIGRTSKLASNGYLPAKALTWGSFGCMDDIWTSPRSPDWPAAAPKPSVGPPDPDSLREAACAA